MGRDFIGGVSSLSIISLSCNDGNGLCRTIYGSTYGCIEGAITCSCMVGVGAGEGTGVGVGSRIASSGNANGGSTIPKSLGSDGNGCSTIPKSLGSNASSGDANGNGCSTIPKSLGSNASSGVVLLSIYYIKLKNYQSENGLKDFGSFGLGANEVVFGFFTSGRSGK
jgi:hypothetical protein